MNRLEAIAAAVDAIEERLREPLTVAQMAALAAYSLYYFCRAFSKSTRHSPHDYLIRRRLTEAAHDLLASERQVADIAFEYQFASHEGFTRAFGRVFGITPSEARRQGWVSRWRCLPRLSPAHLRCLQAQRYLAPEIVAAPRFAADSQRIGLPPAQSTLRPLGADLCSDPLPVGYQPADSYACFTLSATADLPLVGEWILHSWLFYAPYRSDVQAMLLEPVEARQTRLYLPIHP